jgi:hypothetical protein
MLLQELIICNLNSFVIRSGTWKHLGCPDVLCTWRFGAN